MAITAKFGEEITVGNTIQEITFTETSLMSKPNTPIYIVVTSDNVKVAIGEDPTNFKSWPADSKIPWVINQGANLKLQTLGSAATAKIVVTHQ